ncbi:TPA: outer membrane beta-barrel protein [Photobacterium damselae]
MMKKHTTAVVIALMFSGGAQAKKEADSLAFLPFWYAGVSLNQGHYSGVQNEPRTRTGINKVIDGLHLGYQINPYLSAELEYQYLGNMGSQTELSRNYRQVVAALRAGHALTERTHGYIKLGGASWMVSDSEGEGLAGVMGIGTSYDINDHLSLRLEYQYTTRIGNERLGEASHHMGAMGVSYVFGPKEPQTMKNVQEEVAPEEVVEHKAEKTVTKKQSIVLNELSQFVFANNSSTLINTKPLAEIVTQMKAQPFNAVITGYTDSIGTEKYNVWLSKGRKPPDYIGD